MINNLVKKNLSGGVSSPMRVTLKHLPYEIGALEPVMTGQQLDFHYGKHHRTYVNNLNTLIEQLAESQARGDLSGAIALQQKIKFNGGGHLNHEFFWESLCPVADSNFPESGPLFDAIVEAWGSKDQFVQVFNMRTASIQGSGWGWLTFNSRTGQLDYRATNNQDLIIDASPHIIPILNMDIWEHAYYIDYKNARPQYLTNMWKIINWQKAEDRLVAAQIARQAERDAATSV